MRGEEADKAPVQGAALAARPPQAKKKIVYGPDGYVPGPRERAGAGAEAGALAERERESRPDFVREPVCCCQATVCVYVRACVRVCQCACICMYMHVYE